VAALSAIVQAGRQTLQLEAQALLDAQPFVTDEFEQVVQAILQSQGRLIVGGIGKSGHIARKIAATLASTGTPSFFIHAAEAGHGDLGMVTANDLVLLLSYSGETDEVVNLAHFAKRLGAKVVGMSSKAQSSLGRASDWHLCCQVAREACPLGVAPTASTAVQLALGDALAMAVLTARGFTQDDFARTHPMGALGRRLYLRVSDVMQPIHKVPHLAASAPLMAAISEMAGSRIGAVIALEGKGGDALAGIFTDSDLRRLLAKNSQNLNHIAELTLAHVVSAHPMTVQAQALASETLKIFEDRHISRIVCLEGEKPVGLLSLLDLLDHKIA
jgi:arabinose-5-phosphate isomerase